MAMEGKIVPFRTKPELTSRERILTSMNRLRTRLNETWNNSVARDIDGPARNALRLAEGTTRSLHRQAAALDMLDFGDRIEAQISSIFEITARVSEASQKAFSEKEWSEVIRHLKDLRRDVRQMALHMQKAARSKRTDQKMFLTAAAALHDLPEVA